MTNAKKGRADGLETWRFFVPIFLHVGIIHFLLNMVAQVFAGSQVEKEMGKQVQYH